MPDLDDVPDELDGELADADDALDDAPLDDDAQDILDSPAFDAAYPYRTCRAITVSGPTSPHRRW